MRSGGPQHVANLHLDKAPDPLAWGAGGRVLAASSADRAFIWHIPPTSSFPPPSSPCQHPAPASGAAAAADKEPPASAVAASWAETVQPALSAEVHGMQMMFGLDVTPDGRQLVAAGMDQAMCLWDTHVFSRRDSGQKPMTKLHGHQGPVLLAVFAGDGRHMATCSMDNTLRIWQKSDA